MTLTVTAPCDRALDRERDRDLGLDRDLGIDRDRDLDRDIVTVTYYRPEGQRENVTMNVTCSMNVLHACM